MKFHVLKEHNGVTYASEHEYDSRLDATRQANALNDELDGTGAHCYVLDDMELWALLYSKGALTEKEASA
jgi:hypothetical protein